MNTKTKGYSALMLAAASGNNSCVEQLINAGADVKEQAVDRMTPLMFAAKGGCDECVNTLLGSMASSDKVWQVDKKDTNGMTALMFAARGGHYECMHVLIHCRGVHVNELDKYSETALMHASRSYTDVPILGDNCIILLLEKGADIDRQNKNGKTALMIAVENGHVEKTRIFLQNGADVNIQDSCRNTAVMLAVKAGGSRCLSLLIEAGSDVNAPDRSRFNSLLMLAVSAGNDECVKVLTEAGADVNVNGTGITPLILAVESGHEKCVKQLVKTGADVNSTNPKRESALMLALENNQDNCVTLLLAAGADVNITNKRGKSTLRYALETGNPDFIRTMIQAGADSWRHQLICKIIEDKNIRDAKARNVIQMLLCAGANVNVNDRNAIVFSCVLFRTNDLKKLFTLLFAAGQKIDSQEVEYLLPERVGLMHLCREAIREHLLQMSNVNLFVRIPELGLPSQMVDYLLYGVSLSNIGKHLRQMN